MPITEPTRDRLIHPEEIQAAPTPLRRPDWIKVRAPGGETYENLKTLMRSKTLHTVCEEAMCPNIGGFATSSMAAPARWILPNPNGWRKR
jgi:lipoate synthase